MPNFTDYSNMQPHFIGIIPARFASTRFPGKPLADIHGKPMVQRVYEQVAKAELSKQVVATDDLRIFQAVQSFGGQAVMTSPAHPSGTDRCGEAAALLNLHDEDVVINIQGDEPFITPHEIDLLKKMFENEKVSIATLAKPLHEEHDIQNINKVKVVCALNGKALYFSRYPIPFIREAQTTSHTFLQHIGIYAYKVKTLKKIIQLPPSSLELCEKLEQLRWLEHGFEIYVSTCNYAGVGIDTPEDLAHFLHSNTL